MSSEPCAPGRKAAHGREISPRRRASTFPTHSVFQAATTPGPPASAGTSCVLEDGRSRVIAGVVGRSLLLVAGGLAVGLAGATLGSGLVASQLYEVAPSDPASYVAVAVLVALVGVAAALAPARRASRVDPVTALRSE